MNNNKIEAIRLQQNRTQLAIEQATNSNSGKFDGGKDWAQAKL